MNKIIKLIVFVAVIFVGLNIFKNVLAQSIISAALSKETHAPVHIGSTNLSLSSTTIDLRNIRTENPRSFPEKTMLDAPQIYINFDLPALFKGVTHFREVKLNLKELVVVKNAQGELNINALKPKQGKEAEPKSPQGQPSKLKIDKLSLSIGRVTYKDYSEGGQPHIEVFDINIQDRQYTNIENIPGFVSLIMFEALTRTSLSRLAGLDIGSFKDGASSLLGNSFGLVKGGAGDLGDTAKGLLNLFK